MKDIIVKLNSINHTLRIDYLDYINVLAGFEGEGLDRLVTVTNKDTGVEALINVDQIVYFHDLSLRGGD